jgi:hypothetical protein
MPIETPNPRFFAASVSWLAACLAGAGQHLRVRVFVGDKQEATGTGEHAGGNHECRVR